MLMMCWISSLCVYAASLIVTQATGTGRPELIIQRIKSESHAQNIR